MPFRTGRHNRRQLIYRGAPGAPAEDYALALVLAHPTDDELYDAGLDPARDRLDPADVVRALNAAEAAGHLRPPDPADEVDVAAHYRSRGSLDLEP